MRDEWEAERERERVRANVQVASLLPLPKPLGSIYRGGEEVHFCLSPLVRLEITSEHSDLYNKAPSATITLLNL
jgi:hypothetical protein